MSRRNILVVAVVIVALIALLSVIFPARIAKYYTLIIQAASLFLGFLFALMVSCIYSKDLKKSFLFLSLFLLIYALTCIEPLWLFLSSHLNANAYLFIVNIIQWASYAMLITSCVYTLRVIQIKRINRAGWISLGVLLALCIYIIIIGIPEMNSTYQSTGLLAAIQIMAIRVFDMAIVMMLIPVLLLYIQHLRAKAQESITFTFIMGGVIWSLLSTYIFQLALGLQIGQIAQQYFQRGSWLDVVYIFGYLIIAIGLYANMKYDEWGFRMIEKALR